MQFAINLHTVVIHGLSVNLHFSGQLAAICILDSFFSRHCQYHKCLYRDRGVVGSHKVADEKVHQNTEHIVTAQ